MNFQFATIECTISLQEYLNQVSQRIKTVGGNKERKVSSQLLLQINDKILAKWACLPVEKIV